MSFYGAISPEMQDFIDMMVQGSPTYNMLPDLCDILNKTYTLDAGGEQIESMSTAYTMIRCRVDQLSNRYRDERPRQRNEEITSIPELKATVEGTVIMHPTSRIRHYKVDIDSGSIVATALYEIERVLDFQSWRSTHQAQIRRINEAT